MNKASSLKSLSILLLVFITLLLIPSCSAAAIAADALLGGDYE